MYFVQYKLRRMRLKAKQTGDFCGSSVVKTLLPIQGAVGSIPGPGTKIPHATRHGQKI